MVMVIEAVVNQADYDNMLRNYWRKEDIDADLTVDGVAYPGGAIAFRGNGSLHYPKKGFKIKFRQKQLWQGHTHRIDLSASYVDKSLIRERLSLDLFAQSRVIAPQAWPVHLTILSKEGRLLEQGLFTGLEHIDRYFFRRRQREIGALYKADGGVVNGIFVGAGLDPQPERLLKLLYDKKEAKKIVAQGFWVNLFRTIFRLPPIQMADADKEDYSELAAFIERIEGGDPAALPEILDTDAYLDWLAINTLVQSNHTYHKNYYLHSRPEDDKWEILPWDYDLTWGRNWQDHCGGLGDELAEGTSLKGSAQMANRLSRQLLSSPAYFERLRSRLADLLGTVFAEEKLFAKIDAFYAEIGPLARQDERKWPTNQQFEQEQERLKNWVRRRRRFLFKELGLTATAAGRPDTIVTQVGLDQTEPLAETLLRFEATVRNIGSASTGTTVGVAFLLDGQYITFGSSGPLEAGASRQIKAVSTWPATPGQHLLTAVVDDINRYPEISETNNSLDFAFTVGRQPQPGLSDAVIKDIAFERNAVGQVRLAALVTNAGQAPTGDVVGVAFLVNDKFATFGVAPPLQAGETMPIRAVQALSLIGRQRITAIVDDVNRFAEENEQNNVLTEEIDFGPGETRLADTVILEVTMGPGRFREGDWLIFEALVKNVGTAPTGDVVGVAFLVNGQYITFGNTAPLPAGETRRIRAVSAWRAVAGHHRLLAIVDDVNRYPEISETNNRFELSFQVFKREELALPDSIINLIDYESSDEGVILTATVANIGAVPTPEVVGVAFFVDGQFATFGTVEPMAAGATATIRANQALPLEGQHTITAIVDDVNRYDELSHQNNQLRQEIEFPPRQPVERRAIWVSRYDWTRLGARPTPADIDRVVETIAEAGFNTIFFQVRGSGDAYYTPGLEPWAARMTGTAQESLGQDPGWDPLARLLAQAQAAGLEVHASFNVYNIWVAPPNENYGQLWPPPTRPPHLFDRLTYGPDHPVHPGQYDLDTAWRQHEAPDKPMPLEWGKTLWASPGLDQVQEHTLAVIKDLVSRYPVDGVHLDYIRYANRPYSFDPASNAIAGAEKSPARDQWQRERVTQLVQRVQTEIKAIRPGTWLSAAVWPYYLNKWDWRLSEGYNDYYQDSKGWLETGAIDAIAPMLFNGLADEFERWQILVQDFVTDAEGTVGQVYPGIGTDYDDFEAIARRIEAARQAGAAGHALFSYRFLEERTYWLKLSQGPYAQPARPPAKQARPAGS